MVRLIQGRIEDEKYYKYYNISNSNIKIFCNISVTYIKKEMTAFEFLTRSLETMISYLIIAVLLN